MSLNIKTMALFRKGCPKETGLKRGHLHLLSVFISASGFDFCLYLRVIEKRGLWPRWLFGGNGCGNVCCTAGISARGVLYGGKQVLGPCMESGWIAFQDSVRELAERQGSRTAHTAHFISSIEADTLFSR